MQLMCQEQNFLPKGSADTFELKFGFAAGSVIRVPDLSPRCVVRSSHRLILPAAGFNGAAVIQPRGQRFKPSISSRMSTDRSFELTVSTQRGHGSLAESRRERLAHGRAVTREKQKAPV